LSPKCFTPESIKSLRLSPQSLISFRWVGRNRVFATRIG